MIYIAFPAIARSTISPTNTGSIRCACSIRSASEPTVAIPSDAPGTAARTATELANKLLRTPPGHTTLTPIPAGPHHPAGRGGVDDMPPLPAREHPRPHGPRAEERAGGVDLQHHPPHRLRHLGNPDLAPVGKPPLAD